MSKQSDQTIVLVSMLFDVIHTIKEYRLIAKIDIVRSLDTLHADALKVLEYWPGIHNKYWIDSYRKKVRSYIEDVEAHGKQHFPTVELVYMAQIIVEDLCNTYTGSRRELLDKLAEPILDILHHVDPDEAHVNGLIEAHKITQHIYDIVDWEPEFKTKQKEMVL